MVFDLPDNNYRLTNNPLDTVPAVRLTHQKMNNSRPTTITHKAQTVAMTTAHP
jgi:hypothetical protein